MRLFIDECVPDATRAVLRHAHHTLLTVQEIGRTGASNGEILRLAVQHEAVLVTVDIGIGDIRTFPLGTHHGIVILKIREVEDANAVHRHLLDALQRFSASDLRGCLLTIDRNKSRLRRPA